MHDQVSHDASGSPRTSTGAWTKRGEIVYEVQFRDVDGRTRRRRLDARSERAAIKEARAVLASRDGGERIVAANVTVDAFADQEHFPMLEGLVAAGRLPNAAATATATTTTATSSLHSARCGSARSSRAT
jgi:hypothetical protein